MKKLSLLLVLGLLTLPGAAQSEDEPKVVTSRVHHLYYLLECLIEEPHRSPAMAATFRARVGNWYPVEQALKAWRSSRESDELATLRFPHSGPRRPTLGDVLERVALQSSGAQDMAGRVRPWLGLQHGDNLAKALQVLEPLHRQYWWDQGEELLEVRRQELETQLRQAGWSEALAAARVFYSAELPSNDPLVLALVPYQKAPGETKSSTRGHSQGGLQVMEVVIDKEDPTRAGVAFHEFMHHLWSYQNPAEKERWQAAFEKHGLWGRLAHRQLNEGLATALGNGWFQQRVSGSLDPKPWYSEPVINAYARELYPILLPALAEQRAPKEAELEQMVAAFRVALPDADTRFDVVAADFHVAGSRPEIHRTPFQNEVMRLGPVRSSGADSLGKASDATFQVFWVQEAEREQLSSLGWSPQEAESFRSYHLRQSPQGWKLAFLGEQSELFALLRRFQERGLAESRE